MKPIPNRYVQNLFGRYAYNGFDGELISGNVTDANVFNFTTRIVMKGEGPGMNEVCWLGEDAKGKSHMSFTPIDGYTQINETRFFVFDDFSVPHLSFDVRFFNLQARVAAAAKRQERRHQIGLRGDFQFRCVVNQLRPLVSAGQSLMHKAIGLG